MEFDSQLATDAAAVFKVDASEMGNVLRVIALYNGVVLIHEIVDVIHGDFHSAAL